MRTIKKLSISMYLIEIAGSIFIALLVLWALIFGKNSYTSYVFGLSMVLTSGPLLFQIIIDKLFDENLSVAHNVINIFLNMALYFFTFSIMLILIKAGLSLIIEIIFIQIMFLTFRILCVIVRRFKAIKKTIFYLVFSSILLGSFIYAYKNEWELLEFFIKSLPLPILFSIILVWLYLCSDRKSFRSREDK